MLKHFYIMLFNSLEFLVFLPIVFIVYWLFLGKNLKLQNLFVVATSYLFYGWWDWRFLFLIAFTTTCSFLNALAIKKKLNDEKSNQAKAFSAANIVINLAILGIFKYYNFFAESLRELLNNFNCSLDYPTLNIILPVGISFYTFQALSYTIDVYRGKLEPTNDPVAFFAFVSFFPQLVAGPIERATNLLPQFQKARHFDYNTAVDGCRQMLWGFFKKVVIADNCACYANIAFENHNEVDSLSLLLGAIFFSFQIYGDFSGYSSIAIGCAKLFGINLQSNFKFPYFSRDIAEFWKRWHISLNKWFVDYVYIPLGGSRISRVKVIRNTFVIFLLSGLWHGANWTYLGWGLYHACLFIPLILLNKNHRYKGGFSENRLLPTVTELGNILITFILVMIGWIIFRAKSIMQAFEYIVRMFSFEKNGGVWVSAKETIWLGGLILLMLCVEWWNRNETHEFHKIITNTYFRNLIYIVLIVSVYVSYMISIEDDNTFIYFQF